MSDKLTEICNAKRSYLNDIMSRHSLQEVVKVAHESLQKNPTRSFQKALEQKAATGKPALICEIKKASPSAGLIREAFNPAELAKSYEDGGATCLSVLTDEPYFQGKDDYLIDAREACSLPVLRKDFMIDIWQVAEARALGADCILLIMAALSDDQALELHAAASHYEMDVLIETHTAVEVERALKLPTGMIGINNRNLSTMQTDLNVSTELRKLIPKSRLIVSESGLKTPEDLKLMQENNINTFLIGESLMKQDDVEAATKALAG